MSLRTYVESNLVFQQEPMRHLASRSVQSLICAILLLSLVSVASVSEADNVFRGCDINVPAADVAALITAINQANVNANGTTVCLTTGTYILTVVNSSTDSTPNGLPPITGEITIRGNGARIHRDQFAPLFRILSVESGGDVTLENVTISGGRLLAFKNGSGILIMPGGSLTLLNTTVTQNTSDENKGYAIGGLADSSVTVINSTITQNQAGGLAAIGPLSVSNSIISNNINENIGGGLYMRSLTTIEDSYIAGNSARNFGGGVFVYSGNVTITNTTFSDNSAVGGTADRKGGAIHNESGTVFVTDSRFIDNIAAGAGGAISNRNQFEIHDSCISGNSNTSVYNDPAAFVINATSNWWGAASGPSGSGPGSGDSISTGVSYSPFKTDGCIVGAPLQNPSFEIADSSQLSKALGWKGSSLTSDKRKCNKTDPPATYSHSGECAFMFKGGSGEKAKISQTVKPETLLLQPGVGLALSAWVDGASNYLLGKVVIYYTDGTRYAFSILIGPSAGYALYSTAPFVLSKAATKFKISFQHTATSGKLYLDDVSLSADITQLRSALLPLPEPQDTPSGWRTP